MTLGEKHLEFWSSRLRRPSFVYIIQGDPHTPVKVGLAKDPLKRLASLQTGNPQRLRLLRVVPGDRQLEASWHKRLRNSLVYGEWFEGPEVNELVEFVTTLAWQMVAHYDGTGVAPGIEPEQPTVLSPETEARWRQISDMWLAGRPRKDIRHAMDMKEPEFELEILRMRGEGGYELSEGIVLLERTDNRVPRTGGFRHLNVRSRRRREPSPVTVRFVEPSPRTDPAEAAKVRSIFRP